MPAGTAILCGSSTRRWCWWRSGRAEEKTGSKNFQSIQRVGDSRRRSGSVQAGELLSRTRADPILRLRRSKPMWWKKLLLVLMLGLAVAAGLQSATDRAWADPGGKAAAP